MPVPDTFAGPADPLERVANLGDERQRPPRLLGGLGPLVVGVVLLIAMMLLAPTVAREQDTVTHTPVTAEATNP